jgi:hypothetical protein
MRTIDIGLSSDARWGFFELETVGIHVRRARVFPGDGSPYRSADELTWWATTGVAL